MFLQSQRHGEGPNGMFQANRLGKHVTGVVSRLFGTYGPLTYLVCHQGVVFRQLGEPTQVTGEAAIDRNPEEMLHDGPA